MVEGLPYIEREKPGEACGVIGIYGPGKPVAEFVLSGLHALQHRGQEGAGISVSNGETIVVSSNPGRVSEVFPSTAHLSGFGESDKQVLATGHVRYGTSRNGNVFSSLQPLYNNGITLAHNGHDEWLSQLPGSDSEVMLDLIAEGFNQQGTLLSSLKKVLPTFRGAYSLVMSTPKELYAARDPQGFRPLHLGQLGDANGETGWIIASEIAALNAIRATHVREVQPGEIIKISSPDESGLESHTFAEPKPALCSFELVYFSSPSGELGGEKVQEIRQRMGEILARGDEIDADIVVGIPESSLDAAVGYAQAKGITHPRALKRNSSAGRTFIENSQPSRLEAIGNKISVVSHHIQGKRVVAVDDSIVRGNTSRATVQLLRDFGATEVHLRIASPPYKWPCFYGMDTRDQSALIAFRQETEAIRQYVGADTLKFLTTEGLEEAAGSLAGKLCLACTTGVYPVKVPQHVKRLQLVRSS